MPIKFKSFAQEFFNKRRAMVLSKELSPASFKSDEVRFAKILPHLGSKTLCAITPLVCDKFLESLILQGLSPATRNRYRALLHCYFKHAVYSEQCKQNPITPIRILSERHKTRKTEYWSTWKEVESYITTSFRYGTAFGLGASLMSLGGCRIGEALALTWEDIEWDHHYVRIRKIVERHTNKICNRTKGQKAGGEYQMILVAKLRETLSKHKKKSGLILSTKNDTHFSYDVYNKAHHKIVADAGLKRITLHDLRRTFATHAERAGFHRSEIGELLGHETLSATEAYVRMDVSHLVEKAKRVGFGK